MEKQGGEEVGMKRGGEKEEEKRGNMRRGGGFDKRCVALFRLVGHKFQGRRREEEWKEVK